MPKMTVEHARRFAHLKTRAMTNTQRKQEELTAKGGSAEELSAREHFIPLRKADLISLLAERGAWSPPEKELFRQWCTLLEATLHHRFHRCLEELKDLYAPFNPDSVMCEPNQFDGNDREDRVAKLFDRFVMLLDRANYRRLTTAEIEQAAAAASDWGVRLKIDLEGFEHLEVFGRGDVVQCRSRRHWRRLYAEEEVEVPLFQRLVVIFQVRPHRMLDKGLDPEAVYLKIFKNIPKQDLDMLLPCGRFRMTLLDRGKILLPTITGIAITAYKLVKGAIVLAFAGFYSLLIFLGVIGGTLGYGVKSFLGYLRTKDKYQLSLTRSLYYQNLDNNAGVLFRILDDAEEQEFREAAIAYALLAQEAGETGWTADELDRAAERFLNGVLDRDVDFEVHDALGKLDRLGCVQKCSRGRWRALAMDESLRRLDEAWDNEFRYHVTEGLESHQLDSC